jgi:hypothetical protein
VASGDPGELSRGEDIVKNGKQHDFDVQRNGRGYEAGPFVKQCSIQKPHSWQHSTMQCSMNRHSAVLMQFKIEQAPGPQCVIQPMDQV